MGEKEITETTKPRSLRRRSSAIESKSVEESSVKEVLSPRSLRRRSQVGENRSANEVEKGQSPSDEKSPSRSVEKSLPKPETNNVELSSGKASDREENCQSPTLEDRVSKKRRPVEENSPMKRQKIDPEEAVSEVDPICEDFEAYPVHFDEGFLGSAEEDVSGGEVTSDSTGAKDKKSENDLEEKTAMVGKEKSPDSLGSKSEEDDSSKTSLEKSGEKKVGHQRIVTRKKSVESPWISSIGEQKSRRKLENVKMVASKTEKQNDSKKREWWPSVTTEEDVSSNVEATPQTINHVVNETQEKTIPSEEK